jgi:hypothetical protein
LKINLAGCETPNKTCEEKQGGQRGPTPCWGSRGSFVCPAGWCARLLHLAGGSKWHGRTRLADGIGVDATVSCAVRATARWLPVPIYAKANRPSARLDMDGNCRAEPREREHQVLDDCIGRACPVLDRFVMPFWWPVSPSRSLPVVMYRARSKACRSLPGGLVTSERAIPIRRPSLG